METEAKMKIARAAGFRFVNYGEAKDATHAICDCGVIVPINETSHICVWVRLIKNEVEAWERKTE